MIRWLAAAAEALVRIGLLGLGWWAVGIVAGDPSPPTAGDLAFCGVISLMVERRLKK